jgi:hypothetical protein
MRDRTFSMWVGRPEAMIKLAREARECSKRAYDELIVALPQDRDGRYRSEEYGRALTLRTEVTGARGRMRRTGTIEAILAEIDPREIETLTLSNPSSILLGTSPSIQD